MHSLHVDVFVGMSAAFMLLNQGVIIYAKRVLRSNLLAHLWMSNSD